MIPIIVIVIVLAIQLAIDVQIVMEVEKHEIAIAELLKKHPEMLIGGDEND